MIHVYSLRVQRTERKLKFWSLFSIKKKNKDKVLINNWNITLQDRIIMTKIRKSVTLANNIGINIKVCR